MNYQLSFEAEPFGGIAKHEEYESLDMEEFEEWEGETGRDSTQRVRWIQESLNKILGLTLKVDGTMGPQTRSAIRSFQQRQGLSADGIVNPKTEVAIKTALASTPALTVPPSAIPPYTQCDFIHPNIDVAAQYALYGMLKSDPASRNASAQMLTAVKTGRLGGIFQENQKVPALRAIQLGLGWYGPLISKYCRSASDAACVPPTQHPAHRQEIIAFTKNIAKKYPEVARQLKLVWSDCTVSKTRLLPVPPRGGVCTRPSPPPPRNGWPQAKDPSDDLCITPEDIDVIDNRFNDIDISGKIVSKQVIVRSCDGLGAPWEARSTATGLTVSPARGEGKKPEQITVSWNTRGKRTSSTPYHGTIIFSSRIKLFKENILPVKLHIIKGSGHHLDQGDGEAKIWQISSGIWESGKPNFVEFSCSGNFVIFRLTTNFAPAWVEIHEALRGAGNPPNMLVGGDEVAEVSFDNFVRDPSLRSVWRFQAYLSSAPGSKDDIPTMVSWQAFCGHNSL